MNEEDACELDLISVIMPAYNAERTISQAIYSVLKQTYKKLELIVIDDCSSDGTAEVVRKYMAKDHRVRLLQNQKNYGISLTRKKGAENANGEWLALLDSDDMWKNDKLEKQIDIQKKTGAVLLYTGSSFMNESGQILDWTMQVPECVSYRELLKQNIISNSSSLVRKDLYLKHMAMDDNLHEDFATWLSILKSGVVAFGVDEPLLIYRISSKSKTGNKFKSAEMNWRTYRYTGLNVFESVYYMCCYTFRNLQKYGNLWRKCF